MVTYLDKILDFEWMREFICNLSETESQISLKGKICNSFSMQIGITAIDLQMTVINNYQLVSNH